MLCSKTIRHKKDRLKKSVFSYIFSISSFQIEAIIPAFFCSRHTSLHPYRHRVAFQVMVEKLLQTYAQVFGISPFFQIVRLIIVLKHPYRLL